MRKLLPLIAAALSFVLAVFIAVNSSAARPFGEITALQAVIAASSNGCPRGDRVEISLMRNQAGKQTYQLNDLLNLHACEGRAVSGVAFVGSSRDGRSQARLYVNGAGQGWAQSVSTKVGPTYFPVPRGSYNVIGLDLQDLTLTLDGDLFVGGITVFFGDTFEHSS
jgi:hypothetical protein